MAINTEKVQEQAANLSAACWNIANQLRGGMDSSEFKNYILGTIFYRYLSERTELYMQDILKDDGLTYEEAFTNADFKPIVENWSIEHLGYIIKPDNLFRNLNRKIVKPENDADKFSIEDYERAINELTGSTLGHQSEAAFAGLFDDMRLQDRRNVMWDELYKQKIGVPSLPEQHKIADFLSDVDEVIVASEEEVANLEQQKKAVMQKIFSQEVRFKKEDGNDFPDWDEKTFEELAKYKKGPFGSALKKEIFVPEGSDTVKVYEQQNAIGKDWTLKRYFITAEYYKKMQSFEVRAGDIIVSCAGTIGEIYILPENAQNGVINQALMRVRENKAVVNQVYFTYIFDQMLSQEGQKLSNGSALKNIPPFADMKKQVVKVPSLPEQQKIADFLTSYDEAITAAKQELAKWKELKKGLLQQMFV